ncbi:MAG TPA: 3-deoxy-manno-octulosonate cytidylyltransferase [Steroidobacteraceae bacterium]|nr:3-deoxy-manno-octulosonate cytidylyltransferase [Steroidobacteraceae bacterium]
MFRVVIPARYASTRLPGKPLRMLAGRTLLEHVYRRALDSGADDVRIATDDERVIAAAHAFGARAEMTQASHASGTDRIAEVAAREGWDESETVVNVQGDEPLLPPVLVRQVAELLGERATAGVATLATPIESLGEFLDPNVVKVTVARTGLALYFSRAPIPWPRDGAVRGLASQTQFGGALRHLGLYAYRVGVLKRLTAMPPSALEEGEKLEQLRALDNGIAIAVGLARERPGPGVDTEEDLAAVAHLLG